ncbi:copper transporter [Dietzia sp. PP-33]|uniref:copper transporter n=1 Tax=Dietzia sp. PP-33 TaxID=2957500 RepID=UPI0029AFAB93|nr:copper transporter [Dietzia sp. PP-33]MDX2355284.1 copper transporter [Dietzia sp. PP-33]
MISLRRHVLTLVAVFLALAVGVVLGSTSVATSIRDAVVDNEETTAARLETTRDDLAAQRLSVDRLQVMAGELSPVALDGRLEGRPVLVVVAPGASDDDVTAVVDVIGAAGGIAAGRVRLTDKAVDPEADAELEALVANLPIGEAPAADADIGTQLGTAIGRAALLRTEDAEPHLDDDDRETVLTTLADADIVEFEAGTVRPGQLALVVTGPGEVESAALRMASFARSLDREGAGSVVAAELGDAPGHDAVTVLRSSGEEGVSTVDSVGSDAGRLATGLALAQQLDREQGHYGLRPDATAAVPSLPSAPAR